MADALAAMVSILRADATLAALVSTRVYGVRLPDDQSVHMPRNAVVLSRAGGGLGPGNRSYVPVLNTRIDMRAYGVTDYGAMQVWEAAHRVLKNWRPGVAASTYLYPIVVEIGPVDLLEPEVNWPIVLSSYQVQSGELTPAGG